MYSTFVLVDLFCGAGGMSLGLEKYFDVKWVVDNDHLAAATLRANKTNSSTQCYTEDLNAFLKKSFHGDPCYPKAGEVSSYEILNSLRTA
jgi:site-specific DNA-cytosine methylase